MVRYFFDVVDSAAGDTTDVIGTDFLTDIPAEAVALVSNLARDRLRDEVGRTIIVRVRDTSGATIFEASLTLQSGWKSRSI